MWTLMNTIMDSWDGISLQQSKKYQVSLVNTRVSVIHPQKSWPKKSITWENATCSYNRFKSQIDWLNHWDLQITFLPRIMFQVWARQSCDKMIKSSSWIPFSAHCCSNLPCPAGSKWGPKHAASLRVLGCAVLSCVMNVLLFASLDLPRYKSKWIKSKNTHMAISNLYLRQFVAT